MEKSRWVCLSDYRSVGFMRLLFKSQNFDDLCIELLYFYEETLMDWRTNLKT